MYESPRFFFVAVFSAVRCYSSHPSSSLDENAERVSKRWKTTRRGVRARSLGLAEYVISSDCYFHGGIHGYGA